HCVRRGDRQGRARRARRRGGPRRDRRGARREPLLARGPARAAQRGADVSAMKALAYRGPEDLRVEERPEPEPGPGEAVLEVAACGICGTDLRIAAGQHRAYGDDSAIGRIPGHEVAGTIVSAGRDTGLREGTKAFIAPNVGCGEC